LLEGFAKKIQPITDLLRNGVPYEWSHECAKAFQDFKDQVTKSPISKHFQSMCHIIVESDEGDFDIGGVVSQDITGQPYPIAFYSGQMDKKELH
jgi:hypothetical protein